MDLFRRSSSQSLSKNLSGSRDLLTDDGKDPLTNKELGYGATEQINLGFVGNSHSETEHPSLNGKGERGTQGESGSVSGIQRTIQLFKYSDHVDKILISVGTILAVGTGLCFPLMYFPYADIISGFIYNAIYRHMNITEATNISTSHYKFTPAQVSNVYTFVWDTYTLRLCFLGMASIVLAFAQYIVWTIAGGRQMYKIRRMYFSSVIYQQVAWFDQHNASEISARFASDMERISAILGYKTSMCIQMITTAVAAFTVALCLGWQLALATLAVCPLFYLAGFFLIKSVHRHKAREIEAYAQAGSIAAEVFTAIRTVTAFNGQEKECLRYNSQLHGASNVLVRQGFVYGLGIGTIILAWFGVGGVGMGYGIYLFQEGQLDPGNTVSIIFVMIIGCIGVLQIMNYSNELTEGLDASSKIYPMIDELPRLETRHGMGQRPVSVTGHLEFRNVCFSYPSRPDVQVLRDVNINIEAGQTVALVGHTGCGKTTVVQLIERFYCAISGQILLDGQNLNDLNVDWLRQHIGLVSQEPALFPSSIADNIKFGDPDATQDDIIKAAKLADAHDFILQFSQGYSTFVGERGCQISGGQKQRIAIARALVRDPKILLLDEATSALDSENELIVQHAMEKAKTGRTTLIIAHRLSTVIGADLILVLANGCVVERGTHSELMNMDGNYQKLVRTQLSNDTGDKDLLTLADANKIDKITTKEALYKDTGIDSLKDTNEENAETISSSKSPMLRLLMMNSPEWHYITFACIAVIVFGSAQPVFAVGLSEYTRTYIMGDSQERSFRLVGIVIVFGLCAAFLKVVGSAGFGKAGALLTTRIRSTVFAALVRQDMTFFDAPQNRVAVLTNRLSADATLVHGASGEKIGNILENLAIFTVACIIGMMYSWKMSLVVIACMPVMMTFGILQGRLYTRQSMTVYHDQAVSGGQLLQECIGNIRLVCAFSQQREFQDKFRIAADSMLRSSTSYLIPIAVLVGLSTAAPIFILTIIFTYGAYLIEYEGLAFFNLLKVFMSLNQAGILIGRNATFAPDFTKAKQAAQRLFSLLDSRPKIDLDANRDTILEDFTGELELKSVRFNYPYRPDVSVLADVNLHVTRGVKLALVGSSGCGKTTISALLERLYDPHSGTVLADGHSISSLNLKWYRHQIGIVSQEPVLFDRSVADNIKYGDNSRDIPIQEVIQVAKIANAHEFIKSLPQGYDTNVGPLGSHLSGGEKQRIAIARALIQNPRVLILDEATSALDSSTEQTVQAALEKACEGRTTIVIAHRLSTIRRTDTIAVLHSGRITESGTHSELVAQHGLYYRLVQRQNSAV